jgi:Leucine-rich repeat (LRR) protein
MDWLEIKSDSLTDLPDGLFKNQVNLRSLDLEGKNLKLRVSSFEGLKSLSNLRLHSMDLSQVEENFFQSFKIRSLDYEGNPSYELTFPIESLNSQETIEELTIRETNLSQIPENFVPTLRSMKQLRDISLRHNLIRSVEAFVYLLNVERIELEDNKIEELPANAFKGCPQLTELFFENNPINVLRGDEFNQLSGLKALGIWYEHIANIDPKTLQLLKYLNRLRLY